MKQDIEGRDIEPGDLLLRPYLSSFVKTYALHYTKSGKLVISCEKKYNRVQHSMYINDHDSKQYLYYDWGSFYILEKNCEIPEKLKKYIRK